MVLEKFGHTPIRNGVGVFMLDDWIDFDKLTKDVFSNLNNYVFRGQSRSTWKLNTRLDRLVKTNDSTHAKRVTKNHIAQFKRASLGRRTFYSPAPADENEWWALGRHYGLATPLLDWTESPFVALFFAFLEELPLNVRFRSVWAVDIDSINNKCKQVQLQYDLTRGLRSQIEIRKGDSNEGVTKEKTTSGQPECLEVVRPSNDENVRLVSQRGLFTKAPAGIKTENWITSNFKGHKDTFILSKILIKNSKREDCLRYLSRMNINHASLFPDLYGAAKFSNMKLEIDNY